MSQSPNPAISFMRRIALYALGASMGDGMRSSTGNKCSISRYYGKTFSKLQNPRKKHGGTKKKFHRQKK